MNTKIEKWHIYLGLNGVSISETLPDPWDIPYRKLFHWEFTVIPYDVEFWNHVLWVISNPDLIKKIMPPYLEMIQYGEKYFVFEKIPF